MAYIKKFDKAINTIYDCLKTCKEVTINICGEKIKCHLWNKFPLCVQDICIDNVILIEHGDTFDIWCGDFDDDKELIVTQETYEKRWRDLRKVRKNHVEYVAKMINHVNNVLKV